MERTVSKFSPWEGELQKWTKCWLAPYLSLRFPVVVEALVLTTDGHRVCAYPSDGCPGVGAAVEVEVGSTSGGVGAGCGLKSQALTDDPEVLMLLVQQREFGERSSGTQSDAWRSQRAPTSDDCRTAWWTSYL